MKLNNILAGAACAASVLAFASPAAAQRAPSLHVQCDGNPNNVSPGETAARLLGAVTLLGLLAPGPEQPDASARRFGAEGIAACTELLGRETNDARRAQLRLANAIHHLEANDAEGALTQLRQLSADRPDFAQTPAFRLSFGLSAMEIEAQALLRMGRTRDAANKAMEMAAAAPYDLVAHVRAHPYVQLTGEYGEAEQRYYTNLIRLLPGGLFDRSMTRQMAGDFAGSADDLDMWLRLIEPLTEDPHMNALAHAALARALAGDMARAQPLADRSRAALLAKPDAASAQATSELLDLYQIIATARGGNPAQARILFAARTTWLRPSQAAVSEVARMLRQGAAPAELTGGLAGDPARFRSERLASMMERVRGDVAAPAAAAPAGNTAGAAAPAAATAKVEPPVTRLFAAIRPSWSERQQNAFSANAWRTERSRYFANDTNERLRARFVTVARDGGGTPAGYALLLHSALVARAEGRSSFMLLPGQTDLASAFVRTGNVGAELLEPFSFDAAQVIAALSPIIPPPPQR